MNDPYRLIEICKELVTRPGLQPNQPTPGTTHCNRFVDLALEIWLGRSPIGQEFHGLMANAIIRKLREDPSWASYAVEDLPKYSGLVAAGAPAIAGEEESVHGHVNLVIVGEPVLSGHWNCKAPLCANVGKENWIGKGLNFAFLNKPRIWILKG